MEKNTLKYNFKWNSKNEDSAYDDPDAWIPYDKENQVLLNEKYLLYQKNKDLEIVNLLGKCKQYMVHFSMMMQISLNYTSLRQIKIEESILIN